MARQAIVRDPKRASYRITLGVALFRAGDSDGAIKELLQALEMRSDAQAENDSDMPKAVWSFFLAMAYEKKLSPEQARTWFDRGVTWMEKNKAKLEKSPSENEEVISVRKEAADLLGISDAEIPPKRTEDQQAPAAGSGP